MEATPTSADERLEIPRLESPRRRVIAIATVLLLVAGAVVIYFVSRRPEDSPYRVTSVVQTSIVKEIRVTGHLELTDEVEVPAPIEGQLVEVFVEPGDRVEEGQLLAQLDEGSAQMAVDVSKAELEVARARIAEAEAAAQRATQALERTERLAQKGLASERMLETARSETAKARAALQAARAERSAAQKRLSLRSLERKRTGIVAPRAGLVLEVPQRTGMIVGPRNRLFRIGAPVDEMHVRAPIGEADIGEVVVGQRAKFEVPTYPGRMFEAAVKHISPDPKVEYGAIFYDVTLETSNPERSLLPGMTAQVRIKVAEVDDVLAVREASLRFTPEGAPSSPARTRVWRVEGTQLEEVPVEPGLSDGAMTAVRPTAPDSLRVDDEIAIGLALDGDDAAAAPSLSLRGHRQ
ncbi:MAG TPA: efflux RND transporter periplasmic adaptor subunit [Polyangiales bacterium]|nr:efflux RND transporter periplasmic adaptor subunit [Polyangiales bacterium]